MSSELISALGFLQINDYVTVIIVTALVYDYLLTLSREIDYVWCRTWTWVSTMFVIARYIGLCQMILSAIVVCNLILTARYMVKMFLGAGLTLTMFWAFPLFLAAADLVMILRVYAMWNRSKLVLYLLLLIHVSHIAITLIRTGMYYMLNKDFLVSVVQIIDFSVCNTIFSIDIPLAFYVLPNFLRLILGVALLALAVIQTLKESIAMGKATKHWWPNQYVQLLMRDGIFYFIVNLLNTVTFMIQSTESVTISTAGMLFLFLFSYVSMCTIVPRFIIGIRELYDRDLHRPRRWQDIDTGFGMSQPSGGEDRLEMSTIAFTDGSPDGPSADRNADDAGSNQPTGSELKDLEGSQV